MSLASSTAKFQLHGRRTVSTMQSRMKLVHARRKVPALAVDVPDLEDARDDASHPNISLTTIDQFGAESGAQAIRLLMERVNDGRQDARHHVFKPALRVRGSSRPLAATPMASRTRADRATPCQMGDRSRKSRASGIVVRDCLIR